MEPLLQCKGDSGAIPGSLSYAFSQHAVSPVNRMCSAGVASLASGAPCDLGEISRCVDCSVRLNMNEASA